MSETYTRMGVRYGRFEAYGSSRWGPGKVHLYVWRKDARQWVTSCRFDDTRDFGGFYGQQVAKDIEVTCKICLKHMERHPMAANR
jgi:hypothetical protein